MTYNITTALLATLTLLTSLLFIIHEFNTQTQLHTYRKLVNLDDRYTKNDILLRDNEISALRREMVAASKDTIVLETKLKVIEQQYKLAKNDETNVKNLLQGVEKTLSDRDEELKEIKKNITQLIAERDALRKSNEGLKESNVFKELLKRNINNTKGDKVMGLGILQNITSSLNNKVVL